MNQMKWYQLMYWIIVHLPEVHVHFSLCSLDLLVYFILHHVNDYTFWYSCFVKEKKYKIN